MIEQRKESTKILIRMELSESRRTGSSKLQKSEESSCHKGDEIEVLCLINDPAIKALGLQSHRTADWSTHYDHQVVKYFAKLDSGFKSR